MKILVVYYSFTGKTELVAKTVARELNADLIKIEEKKERKTQLVYLLGSLAARLNRCSQIKPIDVNLGNYDIVFLGSPVWWYRPTPAINAFIAKADLKGKHVVILLTMGDTEAIKAVSNLVKKLKQKQANISGLHAISTGKNETEQIIAEAKKIAQIYSV